MPETPNAFILSSVVTRSFRFSSGQTVPLDVEESAEIAKAVVEHSRKEYAKPKAIVEKQMEALFDEGGKQSSKTSKIGPRVSVKLHGL